MEGHAPVGFVRGTAREAGRTLGYLAAEAANADGTEILTGDVGISSMARFQPTFSSRSVVEHQARACRALWDLMRKNRRGAPLPY